MDIYLQYTVEDIMLFPNIQVDDRGKSLKEQIFEN